MTVDYYHETFNDKPVKNYEIGSSISIEYAYRFDSPYESKFSVVDLLTDFVKQPNANSVEELIIGVWQDAYENSPVKILDFLINNKEKLSNVKHLFFGDMTFEDCEISWIIQTNYEDFLKSYNQIETLIIRGTQGLELGTFNLPQLKTFCIQSGGLPSSVLSSILNSSTSLSNLESLELWLGTDEYGADITVEQLSPLFQGTNFPKLKFLGLKDSHIQDELVKALSNAPVLDIIKTLDISMGTLSDEGAEAIFNNTKLEKIEFINCRHHFITKDWIEKLVNKFGDKINLDDQQVEDDDWRYVEVGE